MLKAQKTIRSFAKWQKPRNDFLSAEFIKKQQDLFDSKHDERQKIIMSAERLALIKISNEHKTDETLWWNKIKTMDEEEQEFLPYSFVKKYGTFAKNILENQEWQRIEDAKNYENRWEDIRDMDKLQTDSEKAVVAEFKRFNLEQIENIRDNYELTDYMKRQPRTNLRDKNFNFEQF